jgi:hypothetical protein
MGGRGIAGWIGADWAASIPVVSSEGVVSGRRCTGAVRLGAGVMLLTLPRLSGGGRAAGLNENRLELFGAGAFVEPIVGLRAMGG